MRYLAVLMLIAATLLISGCETMHGLGKDVEKAGEWVQEKTE